MSPTFPLSTANLLQLILGLIKTASIVYDDYDRNASCCLQALSYINTFIKQIRFSCKMICNEETLSNVPFLIKMVAYTWSTFHSHAIQGSNSWLP